MAIVRKSLDQIRARQPSVDRARLAATTEEDIRRHAIEDDENPDAPLAQFALVIPVHAVRRKLGMTQEAFADLLRIPIGTIRNWEQNRVQPDPAARALLTILYRQPKAALKALQAA
ncbi:MAG: helix-turn-helix domain-containing protein [Methylovirgula sp.]|uniref:helix-turn-helix domain-containing protein n=1 Tax=Methylovirgula sp. TaxID=1978224 RepID=UPI003076456D